MSSEHRKRATVAAMWIGLACTVIATIAPFLGQDTSNGLAGHVRAGYPFYSSARVDTAVDTYLAYLTGVNAMGVMAWLAIMWAVNKEMRRTFRTALTIFVTAAAIGLFDLLIKDTSGDTGLPPVIGWIELLPCAPGLIVLLLVRGRPDERMSERT